MKNIIISLLALALFTGCNDSAEKKLTADTKIEKIQSKEIVLKDTIGNSIKVTKVDGGFTFQGFENKIVLLNFFATWCPPCKAEIPHLNNLQKKYKDDIKIISILLEENKSNEDIIKFINTNNVEFTITNSPDNYKQAKEVGGVEQIPLMIIYDRKGKYSQHYIGAVPEEMIDIDIQKVL